MDEAVAVAHEAVSDSTKAQEPAPLALDKKRIAEQLEALKRKELELRRALAIADHPELADAIRLLDGRAYALVRVESKIAQGLSKSEERRKETLQKKLSGLEEKRAELNAQIAELNGELDQLVNARTDALHSERKAALNDLIAALGEHAAVLAAAGLDVSELVPEIGQRMPEIRAVAEQLVAARA
jgi:chromosome segregation ATPase